MKRESIIARRLVSLLDGGVDAPPEKSKPPPLARLALLVAASLLAVVGAIYAGLWMFANFKPYDDEGYFLVLVKHLLDGHRMYDDVPTVYGPAFLLYRWLLNGLCALPLGTDGVRITTLGAWFACALFVAWLVRTLTRGQRFSGWCTLGATGLGLLHLSPFASEPGHPQDLAQMLLLGGLAAFIALRPTYARSSSFLLGLALAGSVCTKINLGLFFGLPVLLLFLANDRSLVLRTLCWLLVVVMLALPWVLLRAHLGAGWALGLGSAVDGALISALVFSSDGIPGGRGRELSFALTGLAFGTIFCTGFALLHGATLAGLYRAIVLLPARFASEIAVGVRVPGVAVVSALASFTAALLVRWKGERLPGWAFPGAELVFALFTLLSVAWHPAWLIPYALPWVWLVLVNPPQRCLRLPLVLCAPLQALQVFPVSGSQEAMGTSLLVPIAVIALADVCAVLAPAIVHSRRRLVLGGMLASSFVILVTAVLAVDARKASILYANEDTLALEGARWTRFDEGIGARARFLADTLFGSCDTFLSVRGDNSQYSWTGIRPASGVIVSHSWRLFDERQEAELVEAHANAPRFLVLDNQGRIEAQLRSRLPFFRMLQQSFRSMAVIGTDELCVRRAGVDPELASCVLLPERELALRRVHLVIRWPRLLERAPLERLQIIDPLHGTLFADSALPDARYKPRLWDSHELLFDGTTGRSLSLDRMAHARELRLELPNPLPPMQASFTLVRFLGANDRRIVTLPIVVVLSPR